MFRIAIDAGHFLNTPGRRVDKQLDAAQTREWVLNDRVARQLEMAAAHYPGVEVLRVDDPTGKKNIGLSARCKAANRWGADVYISIHHNAGIKLGKGGGIVAYCYKTGTKAAAYRDRVYEACIAAGGLRGNRSNPTPEKGYYVLKHTKAPAVLVEYGFMDSRTDAPVILTEDYAARMGTATMEAIAAVAGLSQEETQWCALMMPVLRQGAKGQAVKTLQLLLMGAGCSCGSAGVDGDFGSATGQALCRFQSTSGLLITGICDQKTWAALLGGETGDE